MTQSSVNRQHMQQAAGKVQDAHGQIGQIKGQLNSHHGELQGSWKGESSAAFTQVYAMFETEFSKVMKDLNIIHEKLVDTRVKYESAEQEKTTRVNGLKGLVNG
ncbi:WXG100 family type VII secretion target [Actinomadura sp. WMMB 499]|uniref:WXG100 family type VII secretion target n=1 Tax=Actinomadura sp. WMMB 499 TaxID=1219491 RepID=UPI00159EAD1C|nr:WXG100 family type VII secretion target [Actinomadura sp. WMMB 499]